MNHLILAETQFFALINGKDNGSTETAYGGFVQEVINLCYGGNDAKHIIVALAFAEIELQHHPQNLSASEENVVTVYIPRRYHSSERCRRWYPLLQLPPCHH